MANRPVFFDFMEIERIEARDNWPPATSLEAAVGLKLPPGWTVADYPATDLGPALALRSPHSNANTATALFAFPSVLMRLGMLTERYASLTPGEIAGLTEPFPVIVIMAGSDSLNDASRVHTEVVNRREGMQLIIDHIVKSRAAMDSPPRVHVPDMEPSEK